MPQVILEAPDISRDHCIQRIRKAVTKLPGRHDCGRRSGGQASHLDYDPDLVSVEQIEGAMEEEGYPVRK